MKLETILVPVDFSDDASFALDYALDFAEAFSARIHLLHAYPVLTSTGGGLPADIVERTRESAALRLGEWQQRVADRGIEVETTMSSANASHAISEVADELEPDLIVMGTRGLSGLLHVMLGSIAERTVRTARCPVLTVKRAPE